MAIIYSLAPLLSSQKNFSNLALEKRRPQKKGGLALSSLRSIRKSHRLVSEKGEIDGDVLSPALRLRRRVLRLSVAGVPSPPSHGNHTPLAVAATLPSFYQAMLFVYSLTILGANNTSFIKATGLVWVGF